MRKSKDYLLLALKGMGMGAADVVPKNNKTFFYSKMGSFFQSYQWIILIFCSGGYTHQCIFVGETYYMVT